MKRIRVCNLLGTKYPRHDLACKWRTCEIIEKLI